MQSAGKISSHCTFFIVSPGLFFTENPSRRTEKQEEKESLTFPQINVWKKQSSFYRHLFALIGFIKKPLPASIYRGTFFWDTTSQNFVVVWSTIVAWNSGATARSPRVAHACCNTNTKVSLRTFSLCTTAFHSFIHSLAPSSVQSKIWRTMWILCSSKAKRCPEFSELLYRIVLGRWKQSKKWWIFFKSKSRKYGTEKCLGIKSGLNLIFMSALEKIPVQVEGSIVAVGFLEMNSRPPVTKCASKFLKSTPSSDKKVFFWFVDILSSITIGHYLKKS